MDKTIQDKVILDYLKTLTILCVDDDKSTRMLYKIIFKNMVKDIVYANDGEDGYQKYLDNDIDIIVSDYSMPVLDGLGMSEKVRAKDRDIPIVLVTAIEEIKVVLDALHIGINSFVKKPVQREEVIQEVEKATKLIIANNYIEEERNRQIKELKDKEDYNSYQEDLGFAKELNILRNDFYYQMIDSNDISLVDFLYHPLDVLSGDAYSARRINENETFYLMVDGMGKGLSASLTAMLATSFINHIIDRMLTFDDFDIGVLLNEAIEFIKPVLLEEEALAVDFVLIDNSINMMYYSKFAMPAILIQNSNNEVIKLKSNNPPLSKYQSSFKIDSYDISDIDKFLIYSDGIVENETKFDGKPYSDYIEDDFLNSFTREDLKNSFFEKIDIQEDDVTLIFINKLDGVNTAIAQKSFNSTLEEVDAANEWYTSLWNDIIEDENISYHACLSFTELYMNAFEHGNLGINAETKNMLLDNDTYFDALIEKGADCDKIVNVKVFKIDYAHSSYVVTHIIDEGDGFDTQILSDIFRNSQTFNGRGVFVSRKNSSGIYYNSKGNSVLFLNKI